MMLLMYLLGGALSSPKIKSKMGNKMNEGMLMPYKKVLDDLDKKQNKNTDQLGLCFAFINLFQICSHLARGQFLCFYNGILLLYFRGLLF